MEHLTKTDYKSLIFEDKEFLIFKNEVTLETFVSALTINELYDLESTILDSIENEDQKTQFLKELNQAYDSDSDVLQYLKSYFEDHFGNTFYIDFIDQEIPLNFKVVERCLIKENLGMIRANTPNTFYKVFHDNTEKRFSMVGESSVDIYPEQIIYKSRVNWDLATDYSFLNGPGFIIKAKTQNTKDILKALIRVHKEKSGEMFSSSDVFQEAELDIYEHKLSKFLRKNPSFRDILISTGRNDQFWKLNVPLNI